MNLHSITHKMTNVAIWLTVVGGNGRTIGDHLWIVEEGEPPEFSVVGRSTYNQSYWTPQRFGWGPFNIHALLSNGFVPPLCGRRSQARRPRISMAWGNGNCAACIAVANQRGIIPLQHQTARNNSDLYLAVQEEARAWQQAGRPTEWPLPSETS